MQNPPLLPELSIAGGDGLGQPLVCLSVPREARMSSPGSWALLRCGHKLSSQQYNMDVSLPDPPVTPRTNIGSATACHDSS